MTEEQWVRYTDPKPMLEFLRGTGWASHRKLRLFMGPGWASSLSGG